jgi:hypothetical protein
MSVDVTPRVPSGGKVWRDDAAIVTMVVSNDELLDAPDG